MIRIPTNNFLIQLAVPHTHVVFLLYGMLMLVREWSLHDCSYIIHYETGAIPLIYMHSLLQMWSPHDIMSSTFRTASSPPRPTLYTSWPYWGPVSSQTLSAVTTSLVQPTRGSSWRSLVNFSFAGQSTFIRLTMFKPSLTAVKLSSTCCGRIVAFH